MHLFFPARASQAVRCTGTPAQVFFVALYIWPEFRQVCLHCNFADGHVLLLHVVLSCSPQIS